MVESEATGQQAKYKGEEGKANPDCLHVIGHFWVMRKVIVSIEAASKALVQIGGAGQELKKYESIE